MPFTIRRIVGLAIKALVPSIMSAQLTAGATAGAAAGDTRAQPAPARPGALARATADRPVEIELRSASQTLVPGDTAIVAIRLRPEPGWHAYWRHAGDVGSAPSIEWKLPDGFTAAPLRWPAPHLIVSPPLASYGYERETHLLGAIHVPRNARVGSTATVAGTVTWVVCREECIADEVEVALTLPIASVSRPDSAASRAIALEEARVPRHDSAWTFRVASDDDALVLRVRPPASAGALADADLDDVRFFVDSGAVISHSAVQTVRRVGNEVELRLQRSQYATSPLPRLTGVLTVGDDTRGDAVAVEVDAPTISLATLTASDDPTGSDDVGSSGGWITLATAALLALVGGTLLNLMPCVLPVLSIKALGVAEAAAHDARSARVHTLVFSAGVLVSMWTLVGALLALRAAGSEIGWGFQLQSPATVGALALILFAAALNMAGVFELSPAGGALSASAARKPPTIEAFLSGVLVTALATPCSAPFLAAAVAYGVAAGATSAIAVFTAMGIGLVWPLALVALVPSVRRWLPKPGAWMVTLRGVLAFPLFATVVWLAWVLGRQAGVGAVTTLLAALTVLAFGLWSLGRFATVVAPTGRRRGARAVALTAGVAALALVLSAAPASPSKGTEVAPTTAASRAGTSDPLPWQPYSPTTLSAARDSGQLVLVDFTADWCLTCKVNERVAFGSDTVRATLRAHRVTLLRADWTTRDPVVTRALAAFRRNSVPFVVLYGRDRAAEPLILPTLLTPGIVTRALDAAAQSVPRTASSLTH